MQHMDDFSWGSTRTVEGETKGDAHGDKDGEFDSAAISMKRWSEWERERRVKNGTMSRDSTFDMIQQRSSSPNHSSTNRHSFISTADTFVSQNGNGPQDPFVRGMASPAGYSPGGSPGGPRRVDNVQVLELPAPLSATPQTQAYQHIPSSTEIYDTADPGSLHSYEASPYQSGSSESTHRSVVQTNSQPRSVEDYPRYPSEQGYDSDSAEREAILRSAPNSPQVYGPSTPTSPVVASPNLAQQHPQPQPQARSASTASQLRNSRGVSLYDPGPVSAPGGAVRIVQRNRRSSAATRGRPSIDTTTPGYQASPTSPQAPDLPAGAAPRLP